MDGEREATAGPDGAAPKRADADSATKAADADPRRRADGAVEPGAPRRPKTAAPAKRGASARRSHADVRSRRPTTLAPPEPGEPMPVSANEIAALDELGNEGLWYVGGRELKLTNLDKVLFSPARATTRSPITKRELIRYFALIAPAMLPHLAERPLNLHRYPERRRAARASGRRTSRDTAPPWLTHLARNRRRRGAQGEQPRHRRPASATLAWLGNQAAFEIHAWTSPIARAVAADLRPDRHRPRARRRRWDEVVTPREAVPDGARPPRAFGRIPRSPAGAASRPGSRSCRSTTTTRRATGWSRSREAVGAIVPDLVSWEWSVANRKGLARLDYTQNASIKTLVAPYAVRPADGAPGERPDRLGRAGRPRPAARPLDDPDARPPRVAERRRPVRGRPDRPAGAAEAVADARSSIRRRLPPGDRRTVTRLARAARICSTPATRPVHSRDRTSGIDRDEQRQAAVPDHRQRQEAADRQRPAPVGPRRPRRSRATATRQPQPAAGSAASPTRWAAPAFDSQHAEPLVPDAERVNATTTGR